MAQSIYLNLITKENLKNKKRFPKTHKDPLIMFLRLYISALPPFTSATYKNIKA